MTLYRVQSQLRASRHELARKEAELSFALEVQRALFPRHFPADSGLEFAAVCVPARGISGDYYDVMKLEDGRVVFVVGDISGKGISAAILMANLQAVWRMLARTGRSPEEVCSQLNRHLYQITDTSRFATLFYGLWNRADGRLCYVNAGHEVPLLISDCSSHRLEQGGLPLGMFPAADYQAGSVALARDDLLVVYSDGITDATRPQGDDFGADRLEKLVAEHWRNPLAEIQQKVMTAVRQWCGPGREADDDMTLLLVRGAVAVREES
jgi:sigma-B regulation protein RsbU (phosphoserine phosphatase)